MSFISQSMHVAKPSYPPYESENLSRLMMRSCKQQAIFWVSSCLCQCNFNIYCFKHIAFQYFSNCPEENSLKASFKCMSVNLLCVIIGTKHCQILHLSQYLSFERKKKSEQKALPLLSGLSLGTLLSALCKEVLHFSCGVTV